MKKFWNLLAIGCVLALTACGSDDSSETNTGGDNGGTTGGDTTGDSSGTGEVSFTAGAYGLTGQELFATEVCEGETEERTPEGNMVFQFNDGSVFVASLSACVVDEELGEAQDQQTCEADGGFWFTNEVTGTWTIDGTTIEIVVEDEEEDSESENVTCSVLTGSTLRCYGIETSETVDLDGNVLESVDQCLALDFELVAN